MRGLTRQNKIERKEEGGGHKTKTFRKVFFKNLTKSLHSFFLVGIFSPAKMLIKIPISILASVFMP